MPGYLSLDIICPQLRYAIGKMVSSRKRYTVMSTDKYPNIFPRKMEAIFFIYVYRYDTASTDTLNDAPEHNFRVYLRDSTAI